MSETIRDRRPFLFLAWMLSIAGMALLAFSLTAYPVELTPRFLFLAVLTVLAEAYALRMPGYGVSLTYPLLIALAVMSGPTATLVVALLIAVNIEELRMRLPATVHAFNLGQLLISNGLAAWCYVTLGGRVLTGSDGLVASIRVDDFPQILVPVAAMIAVGVLGNFSLLACGYSLKHGVRLRDVLADLGWLPPVQVALAGVGLMIAEILAANVIALPLFVFPLFVARQFYQRFMALQDAYTDTIRSLVTALEAKDAYTRGHSERVAAYSVLLARGVGLDERVVHDIENAALLHDLGKLTIGGQILRKSTALDQAEWGIVKTHPEIGAAMVTRIPHLRKLADTVSMHHERLDGSGYPQGLKAGAIPVPARILAIADSFDAMTTDRPYRPGLGCEDALAELVACKGKLYDPGLVDSFCDAFEESGSSLLIAETRISPFPAASPSEAG